MSNNPINENYVINFESPLFERKNLLCNNYIKNDYTHSRKISQINSNLKPKIKPEIIINEYHQTSNNINTNINIRTNNDNPYPYYYTNHTYYKDKYLGNSYVNHDYYNNFDKLSNFDRNNANITYNSRTINTSSYKSFNSNENSEFFSPCSNKYQNREREYKKRNLNYMENYKNSNFDKYNIKINSSFYKSPIYNKENNNNNYIDNNKYLNSYYEAKARKSNSQEPLISRNELKYRKRNYFSINLDENCNKRNKEYYESSIDSFKMRKIKEMNDKIFPEGEKLKNIFEIRLNKKNPNLTTKDSTTSNNNDSLIIKLEYYRIKLFKEFFKHFIRFYRIRIKKYYNYFVKKIKNYKLFRNNKFVYNRKSFIRKSNSVERKRPHPSNILYRNNNIETDLIDIFKSSTINDFYRFYNHFKRNHNIDPELIKIFNSYLLKNGINSSENKNQSIISSNSRHYFNKVLDNKNIFKRNSYSPLFHLTNSSFINSVSFREDSNEKELFRDSKELNKKFEKIQRRKKSKSKNKGICENQNNISNSFKNFEVDSITNSEEYNEFIKLRKYLKTNQNDNHIDKNSINLDGNNKIKFFKKTNYIKDNNNKNENGNEINLNHNYNSIYHKTYYDNNSRNNIKKIILENQSKENINKEKGNEKIKQNQLDFKNIKININPISKNNNIKENSICYNQNNKSSINKIINSINNIKNIMNNYNRKNISSHLINIPNNKNNNYTNSINNNSKLFSKLIKDISTKDKRIKINIYYYYFPQRRNNKMRRYDFLIKSKNFDFSYIPEKRKNRNINSKLKFNLASIKEEEIFSQNSKLCEESDTLGNYDTYQHKKNYKCNQNEKLLYIHFIDIINNLYKKKYFYNFIILLKNNYIKKDNNIKNIRIYNKKPKNNKQNIENTFKRNNNNNKFKYYNKRYININQYKDNIDKFRMKLIKYILMSNKK